MARPLSDLDRDGRLTLGLTAGVLVLSLGLAWLYFLARAWRSASRPLDTAEHQGVPLVFGKRLQDNGPDLDFRLRLDRATGLSRTHPGRPIVLLGGRYAPGESTEAEAGRRYLEAQFAAAGGVAPPLILEDQSLNTLTNLRNARTILAELPISAPVVFISNRYHLARCGMIGDRLGIAHTLCPAEPAWTWTRHNTGNLAAEAIFLLWFETGRTWAHLTANQRMQRRIS